MTLVTGAARSGTTLTTAVLAAHGARLGNVNVLNEHTGVRDRLVKPELRSLGADPLGQDPLPDINRVRPIHGWRDAVLAELGPADVYKDAKVCLLWPIWAAAFPEAQWIVVRRDREAIVDSCLRAKHMRAFDTRDGWRRWVEEHERRFAEMHAAGLEITEVWPDPADPESFRSVVKAAGLAFDADKVRACVDPQKWGQAA